MAEERSGSRLELVVVTHERKLLEVRCDRVSIPARLGYLTILPRHTPLISTLAIGELSFDGGGEGRVLALSGGFFEVSEDVVTVLADSAELPEDIDTEAAKQDLTEAREAMPGAEGMEVTALRHRIQHAETRLRVARATSRSEPG